MMNLGKGNVMSIQLLPLAKLKRTNNGIPMPYFPYIDNEEEGDPDNGIALGRKFEALPDNWTCPVCEAEKMLFENQNIR